MAFLDSSLYIWVVLPIIVFFARVSDVTLGTLRIIFISRGKRNLAPFLGFVEVFIWITVVSQIVSHAHNLLAYLAYAASPLPEILYSTSSTGLVGSLPSGTTRRSCSRPVILPTRSAPSPQLCTSYASPGECSVRLLLLTCSARPSQLLFAVSYYISWPRSVS
jgi:hypothetical protein